MSLKQSLFIASSVARCSKVIQKLRENESLTEDEQKWTLNLFDIKNLTKSSGKISILLIRADENNFNKFSDLSNQIHLGKELSKDDWKIILNGLEYYQNHLLGQFGYCDCSDIY